MVVVQASPEARLRQLTFELDRREVIPRIVGDHRDFLIVSGLAGSSKDVASLTDDGTNAFTMAGAMGAAVSMGLGLALAQPDRRILVVTGEGELLMNLGALATVAVMSPNNLAILCVDNGHYGETGYQRTPTSFCTDLEAVAAGSGIRRTVLVEDEDGVPLGASAIRGDDGPSFVLLRVKPTEPPAFSRNLHGHECRARFRNALLSS